MKKLMLELRSEEMHRIHSDLVADILTRLDAKTLSNSRRVCKTWYQRISDPIFIAGRRKFILRNSNLLFLDFWVKNSRERIKNIGNHICTFSICNYNLIDREEGDYVFTSIISTSLFKPTTCDLLCFTGRENRVYLYDPRIGEVHTLPRYPRSVGVAAYGYDSSTREYTVVAYTDSATVSDESVDKSIRLAKISFSKNSVRSLSWKEIYVGYFPPARRFEGILINNYVYWLMGLEIVSLDLDKKTYAIIKGPLVKPEHMRGLGHAQLIDYEGSLCIIDLDFLNTRKEVILWEFLAKTESWMKKYHVKHDFNVHIFNVHPKSKEGELILNGHEYFVLNPKRKRVEHIKPPYSSGNMKDLPPMGQIRHLFTEQVSFFW